jgi:hypothetical protein
LALSLCLAFPVLAEQSENSPPEGDSEHEPVPYTEEEFPDWLKALRRGEIIALGSLPLTFAFSFIIYDIARYVYHGFDSNYLPIASPSPVPYEQAETIGVLIAAGTASVILAVIDGLIGRAQRKRQEEGGAVHSQDR